MIVLQPVHADLTLRNPALAERRVQSIHFTDKEKEGLRS